MTAVNDEYQMVLQRVVREQYGPHQLNRAADGGCQACPLSAWDEIHKDRPVRRLSVGVEGHAIAGRRG
jgi:hypothetical protein